MFWKELTASEYRILAAIPRSLTYTEVARKAGFSPSYVSSKIKSMVRGAQIRFHVDYRAIGLSPMYIYAEYNRVFFRRLSKFELPFVKRVLRVWAWDGAKILIEACPPLGMERQFAYMLPLAISEIWVKEWEAKYVPSSESLLVRLVGNSLEVAWDNLPSVMAEAEFQIELFKPVNVDKLDLMILREKDFFSFTSLSEIAGKVRVSQQLVSYHYRRHVKPVWKFNYIEPMLEGLPIVYRVETSGMETACSLLACLSQVPWLVDAFVPQGSESEVVALLSAEPDKVSKMHSSLLRVEGVIKAEPLAFVDSRASAYHGVTAYLGREKDSWSLEPLARALRENV